MPLAKVVQEALQAVMDQAKFEAEDGPAGEACRRLKAWIDKEHKKLKQTEFQNSEIYLERTGIILKLIWIQHSVHATTMQ